MCEREENNGSFIFYRVGTNLGCRPKCIFNSDKEKVCTFGDCFDSCGDRLNKTSYFGEFFSLTVELEQLEFRWEKKNAGDEVAFGCIFGPMIMQMGT